MTLGFTLLLFFYENKLLKIKKSLITSKEKKVSASNHLTCETHVYRGVGSETVKY